MQCNFGKETFSFLIMEFMKKFKVGIRIQACIKQGTAGGMRLFASKHFLIHHELLDMHIFDRHRIRSP